MRASLCTCWTLETDLVRLQLCACVHVNVNVCVCVCVVAFMLHGPLVRIFQAERRW